MSLSLCQTMPTRLFLLEVKGTVRHHHVQALISLSLTPSFFDLPFHLSAIRDEKSTLLSVPGSQVGSILWFNTSSTSTPTLTIPRSILQYFRPKRYVRSKATYIHLSLTPDPSFSLFFTLRSCPFVTLSIKTRRSGRPSGMMVVPSNSQIDRHVLNCFWDIVFALSLSHTHTYILSLTLFSHF